jgi:hypothetical protein
MGRVALIAHLPGHELGARTGQADPKANLVPFAVADEDTAQVLRQPDRTDNSIYCATKFEWQHMPSKITMQARRAVLLVQGLRTRRARTSTMRFSHCSTYESWSCDNR